MRALFFGAAASIVVVACSRPAPPLLVPKHVTVTYVSPTTLGLEVTVDATNPNAVDLTAGDVNIRVVLDKHIEVGATTVEQNVTLPANQTTELRLIVAVPWLDVVPLVSLTTSDRKSFPYALDATLSLGGELLHVGVPFHMDGNVSRDQILRATLSSIPQIPGITAPPVDASAGPGTSTPSPAAPIQQGRRGAHPIR
jgi:hypothetical protein